jgi:hypothetical protein
MLTGLYEWRVPLLGTVLRRQHPGGKPPCDWWAPNRLRRACVSTDQAPP